MADTNDILGQDALLAEASRWFAALDAGTASAAAFEAWRSQSPAHAVAYARIVSSWESVGSVAPATGRSNATTAVAPAQASRRQWLKAAAVGLPVAMLSSSFLARRAYAWETTTTLVGERRRVALPDGSVAYLNTDSSLSWRIDGDACAVRLDRGEVALDVRRIRGTTFQANGNRFPLAPGLFDARLLAGRTELTLIDGSALRLPEATPAATLLRPREAIVIDGGGAPRVEARSSDRIASMVAWRTGGIVFLDQPVAAAAAEFNRYLTHKIVVRDAVLARETIGGRFDLGRPDQFLNAVALSFDARVVRTATGYELTR